MEIANAQQPQHLQARLCVTHDTEGVAYLMFSEIGEIFELQDVERRLIRDAVRDGRLVLSYTVEDDWPSDYCCRLAPTKVVRTQMDFANYVISSYDRLARVNKGMLNRRLSLVHCVCASETERSCLIAQCRLVEALEKW